jgi:hypothetical protein
MTSFITVSLIFTVISLFWFEEYSQELAEVYNAETAVTFSSGGDTN